jgi:hypothetical protein
MNNFKKQINNREKKCKNCKHNDLRFTRGYCSRCYPLILRIEKIQKGLLPELLQTIKESGHYSFDKAMKEYIWQIKWRLKIIKDAYVLENVSAHDLEYRINGTLRMLDGKSLGKINDSIASYLQNDIARSYVYQLFSKIQLLKPFKIDYHRVYEEASKKHE